MNIWQIQEWAKNQKGEPMFLIINKLGGMFEGKFIDKGFGFAEIPALGDGIISFLHWSKDPPAAELEFMPIGGNDNDL
jgi:hypothetical protein